MKDIGGITGRIRLRAVDENCYQHESPDFDAWMIVLWLCKRVILF